MADADAPQFVENDADTMRRWGIDPSTVQPPRAPPLVVQGIRQPSPGEDDAATMQRWGVDPAAVGTSPLDRINTAAAKLGIPSNAPMAQKTQAIFAATHARQQQIEGASAMAQDPVGSAVLAGSGNAVSGIPIVGPVLQSTLQKSSAAARAMIYGTPYADNLSQIQGAQNEATAEHPILSTAGSVAGGVLGYAGASALGAGPALGLEGSLGTRVGMGAASNAVIGGTDAAVRGNDPRTGALIGGALGAAAPVAGKLIGAGAEAATNWLSAKYVVPPELKNIPRAAINLLAPLFHADDPTAVQDSLHRFGDTAMLADVGPSMQGVVQGLATKPNAAKSVVYNALSGRAAGRETRLNTDINDALGPAQDPQAVTDAILEHRNAVDAQNYGAVHAIAPPVNVSPVVAAIDRQLPTAVGAQRVALQTFRNHMIADPGDAAQGIPQQLQTNSEFLHNVRQEADAVIDHDAPGLGVQAGAVARAQGALKTVRGALDGVLKTQVPGMAGADAESAALAKRAAAVKAGTQVLSSGKTAQAPESFANNFNALQPGEQIAQNIGLRGDINRIVGTNSNDVAAMRGAMQGEGGWNTAKLATSFGQKPADQVVNALAREGAFSETMNRVVNNAQTGQRVAATALLKDTDPAQYDLGKANPLGLLALGAKKLINPAISAVLRTNNEPRDIALAKMLTAQGNLRDMYVRGLTKVAQQQNALSSAASRAGSIAGGATNFLIPSVNAGLQGSPSSRNN